MNLIKKYPKIYSLIITFLFYWFLGFLFDSDLKLGKMYTLTFLIGKLTCWIGKLFGSTCLYSSPLASVQIGTIGLIILFCLTYFLIRRNLKKHYSI